MNKIKLETITFKEATEEAGGNEQLFEEMIDKFRHWLQQQMHLPQEISAKRLQRIILASKFNLEKAKKQIDTLYTARTFIPEIFANYDPLNDHITQFHKCVQWITLPKLTPQKHRVILIQYLKDSGPAFNVMHMMKYNFMLMDIRTEEDTVNSDIIVWNCTNLTLEHIMKYTPNVLKKINFCLEGYGIRFKAIYVIHSPTYIDKLLKLVKLIMPAKLYARIHIVKGIDALEEIIPKSILPVEYGGEELSIHTLTDMWHAKFEEKRDWLMEQEKLKTNESLRSDGAINADELFGVAGTFRKLEID